MKKNENFDERYHASYAAKLKTVPLEKLEHLISKVIGELTEDKVECTIINFSAEEQYAKLVIALDFGKDKRYSK